MDTRRESVSGSRKAVVGVMAASPIKLQDGYNATLIEDTLHHDAPPQMTYADASVLFDPFWCKQVLAQGVPGPGGPL